MMDMSVVAGVMREHAKVDTLEKVNVSLMKTTQEQAELQATKLIESVAPLPAPEGGKGHSIDLSV